MYIICSFSCDILDKAQYPETMPAILGRLATQYVSKKRKKRKRREGGEKEE